MGKRQVARGKERVMTEREYIKYLEDRVKFLEGALEHTIRQLDRVTSLMENLYKRAEQKAKAQKTDCAWK